MPCPALLCTVILNISTICPEGLYVWTQTQQTPASSIVFSPRQPHVWIPKALVKHCVGGIKRIGCPPRPCCFKACTHQMHVKTCFIKTSARAWVFGPKKWRSYVCIQIKVDFPNFSTAFKRIIQSQCLCGAEVTSPTDTAAMSSTWLQKSAPVRCK